MKKNWQIFAIWIVVSAVLYFGLLALELSGSDDETTDGETPAVADAEKKDDDSVDENAADEGSDDEGDGSDDRSRDNDEKEKKDRKKDDEREEPTVESVIATVSALRGLPVKDEIEISYMDQEELREVIEDDFAKEYSPGEVEAEEQALKAIGLIDEDVDLMAVLQDLLVDQIAGFYDDETKQLALISGEEELNLMNEVTLAHEVTHALQDQSFSLGSIYPVEGPANSDADAARLALIEGDATLAMTEYVESELSLMELFGLGLDASGASSGLLGVPDYIDESLLFPYVAGEEFVAVLKEEGGWAAVDAAYVNLPESTEQILHPEKYLAGEHPSSIAMPALAEIAGPGWSLVYEDTLGEFDLRELFSGALPLSDASAAAAGWDGGGFNYYERSDGAPMVFILTSWDDEEEAIEFTDSAWAYLEAEYLSTFEFPDRQFPYLETWDGDYWVLAKKGKVVMLARVPDRTLVNLVTARVMGIEPKVRPISDRVPPGSVLSMMTGVSD